VKKEYSISLNFMFERECVNIRDHSIQLSKPKSRRLKESGIWEEKGKVNLPKLGFGKEEEKLF